MLAKLARCTASLHARASEVEVVFVTIDPRRDATTVMHRFISRFAQPGESRLVGLTGTPREIEAVERAYHVWSQHSSSDIAHTAVIFLIDPLGRIRDVRDDEDSQKSLAGEVEKILG
jgi:protein SCO1/2